MVGLAIPEYQRIREFLLESIKSGALRPGDKMPTEKELVERFGVAHMTVRHATDGLVRDGLVVRRRGSGTFVLRNRAITRSVNRLQSFSEEVGTAIAGARVVRQQEIKPDGYVAEALELPRAGRVTELVRVRTIDETPGSVQQVFVPIRVAPHLAQADMTDRSLYRYLDESGCTLERAEQQLFAVAANAWIAEMLGVSVGSPLLATERLSRDADNRPVEFARAWSQSDLPVWVEMRR